MKHVTAVFSFALFFAAVPVLTAVGDDATTFTSVRLAVDDKGAGVLTVDSRPVEKQPESSSSEHVSLKVFGKATVSKREDGRLDVTYDFKNITEIADVIPSYVPPQVRTALEKQLNIDGYEGVLVLIPNEAQRIQLPFARMIRPPFEIQVDLIGHSEGLLQLTTAPGNYLLGVSLHGANTPEEGVEPNTVAVFERPAPKEEFKTLLKITHGSSEQREYRFRANADAIQRNTMLSIGYLGELPLAIRRIQVTASFPASFGMALGQRGNRVMVTQVLEGSATEEDGIKKGDILLAVDGKAVADSATALNLLAACEIGSPVKLSVLRFGKKQEIEVTPK
ncbi:MAG: PDZ domain-containing protein [Zavarzinella sp.]